MPRFAAQGVLRNMTLTPLTPAAELAETRPGAGRASTAPRSIPEQIAGVVSGRILSGALPHGTHLKGPDLAAEFEVSRATIHDALRILERYGLVQIQPRRGAFVAYSGQAELGDILDVRAVLFGLAARRSCEVMTDEFLEGFGQGVARLQAMALDPGTSPQDYGAVSMELQRSLGTLANNPRLLGLLDDLANRQRWPLAFRNEPLDHTTVQRRSESAGIWRELADALARRDCEAAERVGRRLIEAARRAMVSDAGCGGAPGDAPGQAGDSR